MMCIKSLYLEIDASGVGLGATLVQAGDDMSCRYDELLDNAVLQPTVFASKSLSSAE